MTSPEPAQKSVPSSTYNMSAGAVAGFNAWFPPSDEVVLTALRQGLVVIDANILLNLYKYAPTISDDWYKALGWFEDRLWFPYQVLVEFWKNRDKLAAYPVASSAKSDIDKAATGLASAYRSWIISNGLSPTDSHMARLADLDKVVLAMQDEVAESKSVHEKRFDARPELDEVACFLARLTTGPRCAGVGSPMSVDARKEAMAIADKRFALSVPPGYMDDSKNPDTTVGKPGDSKYGDFFLWHETLERAKEFTAPRASGKKYVVFVTADMKKDWWRSYVTPEGTGNLLIPRPELVEEMRREADVEYIQLSAPALLTYAKMLDIAIGDEAIVRAAELAGQDASDDEWLPGVFSIQMKDGITARATIDRQGQRCRVLAGSLARIRQTPTMPQSARRDVISLIKRGVVVGARHVAGAYEFTTNYEFGTTSAAACVIRGASVSGPLMWQAEDGRTLGEILAASEAESEGRDEEDDE